MPSWAYYNEFDPKAAAWLRELISAGLIARGVVDERSILDVRADELSGFTQCHFFAGIGGWSHALRLAGWPDERPVWTGSPPCQPFSVAGEGKGQNDERHLAPHFVGLVRSCRPSVLFGEQVASSAVFGKAAKGRRGAPASAPDWAWIDDLSDRLEAARYAIGAVDFPSAGVGAPHIRQRTYFGAVDTIRMAKPDRGERHGVAEYGEHDRDRTQAGRQQRDGESSRRGETKRLADAECLERQRGRSSETLHEPGSVERTERLCDADRLGYSIGTGLERHRRDGKDRHEPGRIDTQSHGPVGAAGASCGMADTNCTTGRENARGAPCDENAHGAAGRDRGEPDTDHRFASDGENRRSSTPDGFWSNADWLFCRDGKWRPVEPRTFPLAHRVSGRVGLLRGYGNAINPQAAKEFIEAFIEATQLVNTSLNGEHHD